MLGSQHESSPSRYIYFPNIFVALDVFFADCLVWWSYKRHVRETLIHASMSKIIAVEVQHIYMWVVINFHVNSFVSELSDFVYEKQMIELFNSPGIKLWSPSLNDFRKSGLFFQSYKKYDILKSLCMAVWLMNFCSGAGDASLTGTRSGKSSHKYLFVFLSHISISGIFT